MFLNLVRYKFTDSSAIGKLYVEGDFECYTLEDKVREHEEKIFGKTAIPYGEYKVIINWSNHFQKYLPLLEDVPGFKGVRIHSGNRPEDTEGCILVGTTNPKEDWIGNSVLAFNFLYTKIEHALDKYEEVYIRIE